MIPLDKLTPSRHNPRRVKPQREAHRQLVASIRAHGLLQPLIVRPDDAQRGGYRVTAGNRRLAALRDVHKRDDVRVPCIIHPAADDDTARAVALAENFARAPMHPLDEATTFARLAKEDGRDAEAIAADFGVSPAYVRQRMRLATLNAAVQDAYRAGTIDTATAEAFASVPPERQTAVWAEVDGHPQHAQHVRNVIAHGWIDASHALFDVTALSEGAVSSDLFGDRVLIERTAFMSAQLVAIEAERQQLVDEEGWKEAIAGPAGDVQDRLWSMDEAPYFFDATTTKQLARLDQRRERLEAKLDEIDEADEPALAALGEKYEAVEAERREALKAGQPCYTDATKAIGTAFLLLGPDGRVRREYRVPRSTSKPSNENGTGGERGAVDDGMAISPTVPTPDDLGDAQLACVFTHEALAVRAALLDAPAARQRLLVLALHERVRKEALAIAYEANGTTLHAAHADGFTSPALERVRSQRATVDPFDDGRSIADDEAYAKLCTLPDAQVAALVDVLAIDLVTAHLQRKTELVRMLAFELSVDVRQDWRPDAAWLNGYKKVQLAALLIELRGPAFAPPPTRKKSELVEQLAALFADAAEGRLTADAALAERLNRWLPADLQSTDPSSTATAPLDERPAQAA